MKYRIGTFAFRRHFTGSDEPCTRVTGCTSLELEEFLNEVHSEADLADGYAPFCKHLRIPNLTTTRLTALPIKGRESLLRSGYVARRAGETPVLMRWFNEMDVEVPRASWLDIILYHRSHFEEDGEAEAAEWRVVAINAENAATTTPMPPSTIYRNALGHAFGGSGVPIDSDYLLQSIAYWSKHAMVRPE